MSATLPHEQEHSRRHWYLRGVRATFSIPGLILSSAFVGFAGLAKAAGLTLWQSVFMVGVVWALPAKVVLIGAILSGASLPAAAFAVALSSIRLMPMVVALVPEMRTERTPRWVLYALSHFVAITSWVLAMEQLSSVPREMRTTFYAGLGGTLVLANMVLVGVIYVLADSFPPMVMAGLLLLTPIYFLTSLWGSAREGAAHVAMGLGIVGGPLVHFVAPSFDLLITGFVCGSLAFLWHKAGRVKISA
ncbi:MULTISPECIES: AzlC family ABC transporter permease [Mesorhizobium]|uniref:Branched-chain amino acid ABC transporter permease n=1 Tax=Mesorhizobium denitrificans TaxID=2294114 RepID=A0A371XDF9_9HYPH|nr:MULTISPECIES: AzlC family ABC transporter permease [Mesorhizobium]RFC67252.1 branched-chain amino acid ABC transporter permease [Mesorhizobium denitrificans]